jgi:glyoxylase-like metal-dependent hydrolase (beta-lactamase superfamily II)
MRLPDAAGYEVSLLSVGSLDFEAGAVLPDAAATVPVNVLLLRGHGETLLVDAGSGPADVLWPGAAGLDDALRGVGVAADEIDAIVLTHLDFDHAGGALAGTWRDDLRPAFPRAIVSAVEVDLLRNSDLWLAKHVLELYDAQGLELAGDGEEFRRGLRLLSAPGHRPGHCVLLVGDELVHCADILHHEAHVANPEWAGHFDGDREQALDTRRAWLARLAETGTPAVFSHVATRGRVGPGYRWVPEL